MTNKLNKSKRLNVSIPKGTKIEAFLLNNNRFAHWEVLEQLIEQLPKSKEDRAVIAYDRFVEEVSNFSPNKKKSLNFLRPLIIQHIINGNKNLAKEYYEDLKKL